MEALLHYWPNRTSTVQWSATVAASPLLYGEVENHILVLTQCRLDIGMVMVAWIKVGSGADQGVYQGGMKWFLESVWVPIPMLLAWLRYALFSLMFLCQQKSLCRSKQAHKRP